MFEAVVSLLTATSLLLGSPGPATLSLAATGASYGIRKGLPFLAGILVGLSVAIVGATVGLAALFAAFPGIRLAVQLIGGIYICYIAVKIASAPVLISADDESSLAPRFIDGFILNLLNPKAYAAFLAIFSQFLLPFSETRFAFLATGLVCLLVATVVDIIWLSCGRLISPIFRKPRAARILRIVFALLMVAAVLLAFRIE